MSCSCDGEPADIWEETLVKSARKSYKCYECDEQIEKGDSYTRVKVLYSSYGWSTTRVCEYCWHDWEYLKQQGHCVELGGLVEAWEEHWDS